MTPSLTTGWLPAISVAGLLVAAVWTLARVEAPDSGPSAVSIIDPEYEQTQDAFVTMGKLLQLQGKCLEGKLNKAVTPETESACREAEFLSAEVEKGQPEPVAAQVGEGGE